MGMPGPFKRSSFSTYDRPAVQTVVRERTVVERPVIVEARIAEGNPDPWNHRIERSRQVGTWVIVQAEYPDCLNYEGRKIMVYRDATVADLVAQRHLDPHFSCNKRFHSPFARFEPTPEGWEAAETLAGMMSKQKEETAIPHVGGA